MNELLTGVMESSLGGYDKDYLEKRLNWYTKEARMQVRDLLLSCVYNVVAAGVGCLVLEESDLDGNYISRKFIFSTDTEF